jgi:CRP-like cAMP-binding protein
MLGSVAQERKVNVSTQNPVQKVSRARFLDEKIAASEAMARGTFEVWLIHHDAERRVPSDERIADFLLEMLADADTVEGFSQTDLALVLGISRPVVSATLNAWARRGWISKIGRTLTLTNRSAVEKVAP